MKLPTKEKVTVVDRRKFKPRDYQLDLFKAFHSKKYKRYLVIWPRRSGKDYGAIELLLDAMLERVGTYYIVFPTFGQGRRVIWDGIDNDGKRFIDKFPSELVLKKNELLMRITLKNQSQVQIIGSKNMDSIVGVNLAGCIFSEFALQDPKAFQLLSPVLRANHAWAIFISTPRGKNHFWDLLQVAKNFSHDWWVSHLTVDDTKHITKEDIEQERAEGILSEHMILQEYFCRFDVGVEGSFYSKYIDRLHLEERIGYVPYEPNYPVHTAWDLGQRDPSSVIMFQLIGKNINIIDYIEEHGAGLDYFIGALQKKEYIYGTHIAPFDINVLELGSGMTRLEKARQLGLNFVVSPPPAKISLLDGIECVRTIFPRICIDAKRCSLLIKHLENYRREWDDKRNVYRLQPVHDAASHAADSLRYLAITLPKLQPSMSSEEVDRAWNNYRYGSNLPPAFRNPRQIY